MDGRHATTLAQHAVCDRASPPLCGGYGTRRMSSRPSAPALVDHGVARAGGWALVAFPTLAAMAVDPGGYAPVGPAKYLVIAVLVPLALGLLILGGRRVSVDRATVWWWLGLLGWWVVTAFTGVDRFHSWIGIPERRLGVVAWLIFFIAYIGGSSLGAGERGRVILGAVVAASGIGLVALGEAFDISLLDTVRSTTRLGGPFGSAAYLGAAGALLVPLAAGVALDTATHRAWRFVAAVASTVGVIAVAGSGTRAAWVGLAVAGIVTLIARRATVQARPAAALAVAVVASTAFVIGGWLLPDTERASDAISRESGSGRLDEWRVAASVIADRPVIGAGLEGYRIVAGQHISADYERAYGRRVLPDRAHNGILDGGVAGGIPAMILLVGLLFTVGRRVWTVLCHGPTWLAGAAVGLVAYVAQQQFLFPLAEIDPMAWLIAGVVVAGAPSPRPTRQMPRSVAAVPIAFALVALWFGGRELLADRHTQRTLNALTAQTPDRALAEAVKAVELRPDMLRVRIALMRSITASGTPEALRAGVQVLDEALDWSPRDPVIHRERAGLLTSLAMTSLSAADQAAARDAWLEVAADDPNNAEVLLELGFSEAISGSLAEAEATWLRAADLAPRSPSAVLNLVKLYLDDGRRDLAAAAIDEAERRSPGNPAVAKARSALTATG